MEKRRRISRRKAIQTTAIAGGALAASPFLTGTATAQKAQTAKRPGENDVILFQGDSITDAGRDKKRKGANDSRGFGDGYPFHIASRLLTRFSKQELKIYNRGISGNKVPDLAARWQVDCIDLKPNLLSILIGVNDIWHKLNGQYDGTVEQYEEGFNELLKTTRESLPDTRLVICEPFVLRCGAVSEKWFPEFDERRAACKRVAEKAKATFVPFQEMFDSALKRAPAKYWAGDGVHPSIAGHGLMAKFWMKTVFPYKQNKA